MEEKKRGKGRPKRPWDAYGGRINVRLSQSDVDQLERLAKEQGLTKSSLARIAIIHYLNGDFREF